MAVDSPSHAVARRVVCVMQVTSSMAGVVKSMESAMKSMNLEKVVFVSIRDNSSFLNMIVEAVNALFFSVMVSLDLCISHDSQVSW